MLARQIKKHKKKQMEQFPELKSVDNFFIAEIEIIKNSRKNPYKQIMNKLIIIAAIIQCIIAVAITFLTSATVIPGLLVLILTDFGFARGCNAFIMNNDKERVQEK